MARHPSPREFALEVLTHLREQGFEAYWAGGCVRDHLLARVPKDYDVATNATPTEILKAFRHRRTLSIGAAFGVVAVVGPRSAGTVEVATFRRDLDYTDGRHPSGVTFSTAEQDALRRDFTINGLFYDPIEDRVLDFVDGVADIQRGVVRAIGEPRQRFGEDKLRLLRAVRMAATFNFEIDPATLDAMRGMATKVTIVSAERIAQEMRLMLVLANRVQAVERLAESGLCQVILPELFALREETQEVGLNESPWTHTLRVLGELHEPCFALSLAALLHRTGGDDIEASAQNVLEVSRRWKLSNDETDEAAWLVRRQVALDEASALPWSKLQPLLVASWAAPLVELHAARARADGRSDEHLAICREKLQLPADELNPLPLLTGDDLIRHGVPRGRIYATLLEQVRAAQLDGVVANKDEALALVDRLHPPAA